MSSTAQIRWATKPDGTRLCMVDCELEYTMIGADQVEHPEMDDYVLGRLCACRHSLECDAGCDLTAVWELVGEETESRHEILEMLHQVAAVEAKAGRN